MDSLVQINSDVSPGSRRHINLYLRQLACLSYTAAQIYGGSVNDNIFDSNQEVGGTRSPICCKAIAVYQAVTIEIGRGLEHWAVERVSDKNSIQSQIQSLGELTSPSWYIY